MTTLKISTTHHQVPPSILYNERKQVAREKDAAGKRLDDLEARRAEYGAADRAYRRLYNRFWGLTEDIVTATSSSPSDLAIQMLVIAELALEDDPICQAVARDAMTALRGRIAAIAA